MRWDPGCDRDVANGMVPSWKEVTLCQGELCTCGGRIRVWSAGNSFFVTLFQGWHVPKFRNINKWDLLSHDLVVLLLLGLWDPVCHLCTPPREPSPATLRGCGPGPNSGVCPVYTHIHATHP